MISEALFGRPAAAAAWSGNAETRRTSLFSYLLAGTPLLFWDNIPRETAMNCDHINLSLTSPTFSDRLFHTQTPGDAPATTIQVFTGNGITAKGDMRSRAFKVTLKVDREDPENRPFKRSDPLRWTRENRAAILRALYTILCWKPRRPGSRKDPDEALVWDGRPPDRIVERGQFRIDDLRERRRRPDARGIGDDVTHAAGEVWAACFLRPGRRTE